jgi:hypothetical protein
MVLLWPLAFPAVGGLGALDAGRAGVPRGAPSAAPDAPYGAETLSHIIRAMAMNAHFSQTFSQFSQV